MTDYQVVAGIKIKLFAVCSCFMYIAYRAQRVFLNSILRGETPHLVLVFLHQLIHLSRAPWCSGMGCSKVEQCTIISIMHRAVIAASHCCE